MDGIIQPSNQHQNHKKVSKEFRINSRLGIDEKKKHLDASLSGQSTESKMRISSDKKNYKKTTKKKAVVGIEK